MISAVLLPNAKGWTVTLRVSRLVRRRGQASHYEEALLATTETRETAYDATVEAKRLTREREELEADEAKALIGEIDALTVEIPRRVLG